MLRLHGNLKQYSWANAFTSYRV